MTCIDFPRSVLAMSLITFATNICAISLSADASTTQMSTAIGNAANSITPSEHFAPYINQAKSKEYSESPLFAGNIVSIPDFPYKKFQKHKSAAEDLYNSSSVSPPLPLHLLRARNLLAAGHYQEAIIDYARGVPEWKVPLSFRQSSEGGWAIALERTGDIKGAMQHAKASRDDELIARLMLKEHLFAEAKAVADNNVQDEIISAKEHHELSNLSAWLRMRACAEYALSDYAGAVRDLKSAADKYYIEDTEGSVICAREANRLIARFKLGDKFTVGSENLPAIGKERVLKLIRYLASSPTPLCVTDISRITGVEIKLPGKVWNYIYQDLSGMLPFNNFEYRVQQDDASAPDLLMLGITTYECCVPKTEVDALFPHVATRVPPIDTWSGFDESAHAEAWNLPTGRLFMRFGASGARVLKNIEFNAIESAKPLSAAESLRKKLRGLGHAAEDGPKKIDLLTKAIALDDQVIINYIERAHVYLSMKHFPEALADAERAVGLGGRFYLDEQADVEEQMGRFDAALNHFKIFIGSRAPGPETATFWVKLSAIQTKDEKYLDAVESADTAMIDSTDITDALFARAKTEAGLNQLSKARADGVKAANNYFDSAQIVSRDRVLVWLKDLPSN